MSWQNLWQLAKSDYLKLVPILALAFYMAFIPNLQYAYPVHIDEWRHIAESNALLQAADISHLDPFSGQPTLDRVSLLEAGFHLFWGIFHRISGISWLTIVRYFPSIIFMFTVLSVYVLARREGFGWEAALLTCLIPTTVGIMGPAFFIPLAMGLLFVPLSLFIMFNFRTKWSYLVLFIFISFLLGTIHAPSAICLVIILIPFIPLNLKGNFMHSFGITLAVAIPFLVTLPWTFSIILPAVKSLLVVKDLPAYHDIPRVIQMYGYPLVLSFLLGTLLLAIRGNKRDYSLVLGSLALLLMLATFYTLHYGDGLMYLRGLVFMMLMMSIVAGAGLMGIRRLRIPEKISRRLRVPLITQNVGLILCLVLIGFTLSIAIPSRQATGYYHMIDKADYEAFVWIRDNVGEDYEKAILDPWKATAFTAITEKYVHTRIHQSPLPKDKEAYAFLESGCQDTTFLKGNGITIVYNRESCSNPNLVEVRKNVYLLKEAGNQ